MATTAAALRNRPPAALPATGRTTEPVTVGASGAAGWPSGGAGEPLLGPGRGRLHDSRQRLALLGEVIFDADRSPGQDPTLDDALALQLLEALGQEPVGEPGDGGADLGEPAVAGEQRPHDRPRPPAPDDLDRPVVERTEAGDRAVCIARRRHASRVRLSSTHRGWEYLFFRCCLLVVTLEWSRPQRPRARGADHG